jgi:hypothetical protein
MSMIVTNHHLELMMDNHTRLKINEENPFDKLRFLKVARGVGGKLISYKVGIGEHM